MVPIRNIDAVTVAIFYKATAGHNIFSNVKKEECLLLNIKKVQTRFQSQFNGQSERIIYVILNSFREIITNRKTGTKTSPLYNLYTTLPLQHILTKQINIS